MQAHFGTRRVYGINVRSAKSNHDFKAHFNATNNTCTIDKLSQNLLLMNNLKRGDILFYKGMDDMERLFIEHASNVVFRTLDKTTSTGEIINELSITRRGGDHFFQAMVYANVGIYELANSGNAQPSVLELSNVMPEQTDIQHEYNVKSSEVLDF